MSYVLSQGYSLSGWYKVLIINCVLHLSLLSFLNALVNYDKNEQHNDNTWNNYVDYGIRLVAQTRSRTSVCPVAAATYTRVVSWISAVAVLSIAQVEVSRTEIVVVVAGRPRH